MALTPAQKRQLSAALEAAYPNYDELALMLDLELGRNLAAYADRNRLPIVVHKLITYAEAHGWTNQLITAAALANPDNPQLKELVASGWLASELAVRSLLGDTGGPARDLLPQAGLLAAIPAPDLERIVNAAAGFQDLVPFAIALLTQASRVCRVEVVGPDGTSAGSGFLVGPDLVLTAHHVLARVLDGTVSPTGVRCRFDYRVEHDGTVDHGVDYRLAEEKHWNVAARPHSLVDVQPPSDAVPAPDELDYALIRLAEAPGRALGPGGSARGWLDLLAEPPELRLGLPLLIVQHPADHPLKLAQDTGGVLGINGNRTRLTYGVNTLPGSSGSPCFTFDLALIALHHSGVPGFPPRRNEGIPVAAIAQHLRETGDAAELERG